MTAAADTPSVDARPARKVRPFAWSVRRELWEHSSVWRAPLAFAAIALLASMYATRWLPMGIRTVESGALPPRIAAHVHGDLIMDGHKVQPAAFAGHALNWPFDAVAGVTVLAAVVAGLFYCLACLNNERRDRSVLFWKSLPVSDRTTVLSKAMIPLVVAPVAAWAVAVAAQTVLILFQTAVVAASGLDPATLWSHLHLDGMTIGLGYSLIVLTLWLFPIAAYLMVVSAWARGMTFVWAIAPPAVICIFEILAFRTDYAWKFVSRRLMGGFSEAFSIGGQGGDPATRLSDFDPVHNFASLELWGGLIFAALALWACVWLRRRRDPV